MGGLTELNNLNGIPSLSCSKWTLATSLVTVLAIYVGS